VLFDRRSTNTLLSDAVMEKVCANLGEIGYCGHIIFSGYNEPFYGDNIFKWAAALKAAAPDCRLFVISNGDYLRREVLERAADVGIDRITVDLYPAAGKEDDLAEHERITSLFEERTTLSLARGPRVMETDFLTISIGVRVCNYKPESLQTRGGLIEIAGKGGYVRRAPCFFPINQVTLNHTGDGMLCCQVRSDVKAHKSSIFSNLGEAGEDLFTYYRAMGGARKHLITGREKGGVCRNCDYLDGTPTWAARKPILSAASALANGAMMERFMARRRRARTNPFR
jgi:hypothetical protein